MRSGVQDGPTSAPCGLLPVPVNLSARQAKDAGLLTSGTYGPRVFGSSGSVDLARSLVNRLQARLASLGLTLYNLTWKERVTPSGRSISALRASVRRTSGSDFTGVPTPNSFDATDLGGANLQARQKKGGCANLKDRVIQFSGVATPLATDTRQYSEASMEMFVAAGQVSGHNLDLNAHSQMFLSALLPDSGKMPNGSPAETGSTDQLNPAYSRWLMGFPPAWDDCAVMAMRLLPRKRRRS